MAASADAFLRLERAKELLDEGRASRALSLLRAFAPGPLAAEKTFLTAEGYRAQGCFVRCAPYYGRLLRRSPGKDPSLWLESCLALASVWRSLGRTEEARRLVRRGSRLAAKRRLADCRERFDLESALIDRASGLYRESLPRLGRFLSRFRRRGDWEGAGFVLWACGGARRFSGDLEGSRRDFSQALSAFRKAGDEGGMAYALFGLGGVSRIMGRLKDSREFYSRALERLKSGEDFFGLAYAHCGLANVLRQQGDLRRARSHYLRSHELYSRLGDRIDLAYVDWGLGKVALQTGDMGAAQSHFRRALAAFARGGEARGEVLSEMALSGLLHARGRTARAEALFRKAWRRARAAGLYSHLEIFT